MVDGVAFRNRTHVTDSIDVVVGGGRTESGLHQAFGDEHQVRRDNETARASRNQQTAFIEEVGNLNDCVFQRSLVEVSRHSRAVAVGTARHQRVGGAEQGRAVTRLEGGEAVVQQSRRFDLLGVRHRAGKRFGVTARQLVVQVVFDGFFGDGETHRHGFVVVPSHKGFLCVVVRDSLTFRFDRRGSEAGQLDFFFERLFGGFGFVDELMLFFVPLILQTEKGIQPRQEFFEHLSA